MKKIASIILFSGFLFTCGAQQTKQFQTIKQKYDALDKELTMKCLEEIKSNLKFPDKIKEINTKCSDEEYKIQHRRSIENIAELERIKKEGTGNVIRESSFQKNDEITDTMPEYEKGIREFQNEIASNMNTAVIEGSGILRTSVKFIVERDGSITGVKATGENEFYNKQAEIAVYLTKYKWKPGYYKGQPVRTYLQVPVVLNFE